MSTLINLIEKNILYEILIVSWLLFLWKFYLCLRQRALVIRLVELPKELEGLMTKDIYDKARAYALDKLDFTNFMDVYSELYTTVFLLTLCHQRFWLWSINVANYFGFDEKNEILLSGICMFIINVIYDVFHMPLKVYSTFVIEQKHGFNKETPLFFVKDQLLKFVVREIIAVLLLCSVIWIIKNGGDYFFFYLWIFIIFASLFMMILYPENSKRSSHSNAYLYGFHKNKRIVLFDTLVKEYQKVAENETEAKGCETDEVLAVLAHELGHWKHSHTVKGFMLAQLCFLINIYLYAKLINYKPMFEAFGFMNSQPTFIGFIIVTMYILIPLNVLMQYITIVLGRKFEFEADKFAKSLGHGQALKSSLTKLVKDNLSFPLFDKLYSSWHHNHPPFLERLEAINKED
ncbi:CAAX prenyl protease 1 homolog isoform X2 [Xylocopa sonorina]|uniref:CAAX prenyl protease 1 homolog isoform X2 n=1 Tax=Xylocopa sonorina TaxID=1818115 RepID=UPI00403B0D7D